MSVKPTLKTIANDLGLSVGTVSRILNNKAKQYRISDETVELVLKHSHNVGYFPNLLARSLRHSKSYTIGLMIPDIANPFFAKMAKNIGKEAAAANYTLLLIDALGSIENEKKQILNMLSRKVDGIVVAPVGTKYDHFNEIKKQNIPLVFIDRYSSKVDIPHFSSDNFYGAYIATKYFIENGHKSIALIKGNEEIEVVLDRRKGYEKALNEANIQVNKKIILGAEFSIENGYKYTKEILSQPKPPTAIFALSNLIGLGVLQAVREFNLSIPNDVSLIIFDDQPYVSYLNPPITTLKQETETIGNLAFNCLLNIIDDNDYEYTSVKTNPKIIVRESVKNLNIR